MPRRPNHLIRNLLITALTLLAAMHPTAAGHLAQLGAGLCLAIVHGIGTAAADQPGAAAVTGIAVYAVHQIRTRRPRTAARP